MNKCCQLLNSIAGFDGRMFPALQYGLAIGCLALLLLAIAVSLLILLNKLHPNSDYTDTIQEQE